MKRLILPTLAVLTILAVGTGCSDDENSPVITRMQIAPECGIVPVRVDAYGAASGGDESGDPTGGVNNLEYTWDFGDGTTSSTSLAYHIYEVPGEYTVTLRVKDPDGKDDDETRTVIAFGDSVTIEAMATPATTTTFTPVILDYRAESCEIDPDVPGDYRNLVQSWQIVRLSTGATVRTYDGKSPSHTFTIAGTYEARLTVNYPAWAVIRRDTVLIQVN